MKSIFDVNISNCIILNPIRHPDDMLRTFYVAIIVISVIFSILIVTMDGVFLVIIIKNKHLRTKPNILLLMMAIPDFLTGAVILPLHAFLTLNFYYVIRVCLLEYFLNMLGYAIVLLSLIVIIVVAIEIYLSVITPFFYQSYISKLKLLVVIATLWMVTILVSLLFTVYFYHHWVTYQCYASLAFVLLMFCITVAYEIIRREIKKIVLRASITQQLQHIQSDQVKRSVNSPRLNHELNICLVYDGILRLLVKGVLTSCG